MLPSCFYGDLSLGKFLQRRVRYWNNKGLFKSIELKIIRHVLIRMIKEIDIKLLKLKKNVMHNLIQKAAGFY